MGKSVLTREEITMLQQKLLPAINKEYRDVVKLISLVAEKQGEVDGDELFFSDVDQLTLLRRVWVNVVELDSSVKAFKQYLVSVKNRLLL